jgi:hypothetical protein
MNETDFITTFNKIKRSDLSEANKLAQAFGWVTSRVIEHAQHEIELAKAMSDQETQIKTQIKMSVMKHARDIFQDCYQFMIGGSAWDEQVNA